MKSMCWWNVVVSAVFTLLGISFILLSRNFPVDLGTGDPGSGFWPSMLGMILIFLSVLLLIESFFSRHIREKKIDLSSHEHKIVYIVMGVSVLFCISTYLLGFI
ncbi:MAG: tripartite tricarboxylate transporter TctB family protein, partial [Sphaerochaetaceae bacterium]